MNLDEILGNVKSKKKATREKAIDNLALAQDPSTVSILIQVLESDKEGSVRRRAALALGRIDSEESLDALFQAAVNDKDEETRRNAAIALGNFGDERAIMPLYEFFQAPRKNTFSDNLDRARVNKALNELAQKKMVGDIEGLIEWYKKNFRNEN